MLIATFFNQNSFLLLLLGVWVLAAVYLRRRESSHHRLRTFAVITLALGLLYAFLSPTQQTAQEIEDLKALIGRGKPVLIEFKSPN